MPELLALFLFLTAWLASAAPTPDSNENKPTVNITYPATNMSLPSINITGSMGQSLDPDWVAGTCSVAINLRQTCETDYTGYHFVTTYAQMDISDNNGDKVYGLHGPGVAHEYPASQIKEAWILGRRFAMKWWWQEGRDWDKITFNYWGDGDMSENNKACKPVKAWSSGSQGVWSSFYRDCKGRTIPMDRRRVVHCPFTCKKMDA